jgi:non-ribosomal peptide synthetase component F
MRMFGMDSELLDSDTTVSLYDLSLIVKELHHGMRIFFTYRKDIFDQPSIIRLAHNFLTLLEGIAADPKANVDALPMLSDAERVQLIQEWGQTPVDYGEDTCIQQLFEAQVKKTLMPPLSSSGTATDIRELNSSGTGWRVI